MRKKDIIASHRMELNELEDLESIMKSTINTITRRKRVLINALDELGASSASVRKKKVLSQKQVLQIKASITKKPRSNEA